ncbi:sugar transferase [Brachybacterium aquaticum]|uniref:Lipopolysaccharide/colanic/teichoic acid biosynthesis glycosyltransferase n=1 Tax=Brachybacterium aquaticum TaxID=1432564 RepID=A0A841AGJ8_9MICO|nr:sugar transferase [Brachybacterium aquaticum]MBB5832721.1 lipopolysaccharide/colanic/teichoic acid biosynthesis glycosyltransferase [Brachybacterium aquaticum]
MSAAIGPVQHRYPLRLTTQQRRYLARRRRVEAVLAGLGLVVMALPMLIISGGVAMTIGRPVLFTQERITQDGRVFRLRKFRSMRLPVPGAEEDWDRLVPFGRLLRETSLDELPSLWNILVGDMSFVGPRPLPTFYLGRYSADQFTRHAVPAGLTGYAQANGRNGISWEERLAMDQEYVRRVGLAMDLRILRDTVWTVLRRHGVTDEGGVSMALFPGPQSTVDLDMNGPDGQGRWHCADRRGCTVLEGELQVEGDVAWVRLEGPSADAHAADGSPADGLTADAPVTDEGPALATHPSEPTPLDEALLVLASRLRREHEVEWLFLDLSEEPADALGAALERAGFAAPGTGPRFASRRPPPLDLREPVPRLVAFAGPPEGQQC